MSESRKMATFQGNNLSCKIISQLLAIEGKKFVWTSTSSLYTYIMYLIKWAKAEFRNNKLVCVKWRPFSPWSTIQTTEESQEFTRLEICVMHLFFSCCSFPKMTVDFENEVWHFFQKI